MTGRARPIPTASRTTVARMTIRARLTKSVGLGGSGAGNGAGNRHEVGGSGSGSIEGAALGTPHLVEVPAPAIAALAIGRNHFLPPGFLQPFTLIRSPWPLRIMIALGEVWESNRTD